MLCEYKLNYCPVIECAGLVYCWIGLVKEYQTHKTANISNELRYRKQIIIINYTILTRYACQMSTSYQSEV